MIKLDRWSHHRPANYQSSLHIRSGSVLSEPLLFANTKKRAMTWDFQQCGMCNQQRLRSACAYAQSDQNLCLSLEYSMSAQLLTEHHLEFLTLKGGCTGSCESTLVKIPHCWKSHVTAQKHISPNVYVIFRQYILDSAYYIIEQ